MKIFKLVLTILLGLLMILGGISHFLNPLLYAGFFPEFALNGALNIAGGVVEIGLGLGAMIPRFRHYATLGILLLMILFLPLHVIDVFRGDPAVGSHQAALIRLPVQFVFIFWAWFCHRNSSKSA
jgi:uncharacterized membrane protein